MRTLSWLFVWVNWPLKSLTAPDRKSSLDLRPVAIWFSCPSMALRRKGCHSASTCISRQAMTMASPKGVGSNCIVALSRVQYLRLRILSMCCAIVASVPMPFFSIREIRSDSFRRSGGRVVPARSSSDMGVNLMPSVNVGSWCPPQPSYGYTSNHRLCRTMRPDVLKRSSPIPISTVDRWPWAAWLQHARKCRTTSSYTLALSRLQPSFPLRRTGWMGGWALSSWPPPAGHRNSPPSALARLAAYAPQSRSPACSAMSPCRLKPSEKMSVSVRG
mmetsp:Transcript_21058/g.59240  ORF Transcript_21058/g.59240 Transcript_21058/m.59240 type:complete len:274 (-) Transcript_21058:957-1778(-)